MEEIRDVRGLVRRRKDDQLVRKIGEALGGDRGTGRGGASELGDRGSEVPT